MIFIIILWRCLIQKVKHVDSYRLTIREKVLCLCVDIVLFSVVLFLFSVKPKVHNISESSATLSSDVIESFYSTELSSEVSVCRTCFVDADKAYVYLTVEQCSGTVSIYKDSVLISDIVQFDEGVCLCCITGVALEGSAECVLDIARGSHHVKRDIFLEIIPEKEVVHD